MTRLLAAVSCEARCVAFAPVARAAFSNRRVAWVLIRPAGGRKWHTTIAMISGGFARIPVVAWVRTRGRTVLIVRVRDETRGVALTLVASTFAMLKSRTNNASCASKQTNVSRVGFGVAGVRGVARVFAGLARLRASRSYPAGCPALAVEPTANGNFAWGYEATILEQTTANISTSYTNGAHIRYANIARVTVAHARIALLTRIGTVLATLSSGGRNETDAATLTSVTRAAAVRTKRKGDTFVAAVET